MRVKKALSAAYRNLRLCSKPEAESDSEHEKCSESDGESGKEARAHDPRFTRTWPDPQWGPVAEKVDTSALNKGPRPQPNDGLDHHQVREYCDHTNPRPHSLACA